MNAADVIAAYVFALRQIVKLARGEDADTRTLEDIATTAEDALAEGGAND